MTQSTGNLAQHLMADLFGVEAGRLADAKAMRALLVQAVTQSGLRAIAEPVVIPFQGSQPASRAEVTGFVVLAESHIAFHAYPDRGFLAVDIFTCGPDARPQAALDVFVETLEPDWTMTRSYTRGDPSGRASG